MVQANVHEFLCVGTGIPRVQNTEKAVSWLGCINDLTKVLAARQSEHGWRTIVAVSNLTAGMRLGRTFQYSITVVPCAYRQYKRNLHITYHMIDNREHLPHPTSQT
jgi:hypothetical protein